MKAMSRFLPHLILFLCFANTAFAETNCWKHLKTEESILSEFRVVGEKIYIQPNQLDITNDGIFIVVNGEQVLVRQLNWDENGIYCLMEYLDTIRDRCRNNHEIWCGRCGGCVVRWCLFRCKCVEWE